MLEELVSALLQVAVFTLIPFVVYLIRKKTAKGFFDDLGLKRSTRSANLLALLLVLFAVPLFWLTFTNEVFRDIMTNPSSVSGRIREMGMGPAAFAVILIAAGFKTALSEEIFFRGFLAKRLIAMTNFRVGNLLQAAIFGIIHTALFMTLTGNPLILFAVFFFPAAGAYFQAYLNEKVANGSIIPGWITHATSNIVSYSLVAFIL